MIELFTAIGSIAAVGALVVSIVSLYKSNKIERIQTEISELDARLKLYELDAIEKAHDACVEARLINYGKNYRLKIFNKGSEPAFNINYFVEDESEFEKCFFKKKTPFPKLEQHDSYEEAVLVYPGFPSTTKIKTTWKDSDGNEQSKESYITL